MGPGGWGRLRGSLSNPAEYSQRLGLPTGPVESEHEHGGEMLSKRLLSEQGFDLGDDLLVTANSEIDFESQLQRGHPFLGEPVRLVEQRRLEPEVTVCGPGPEAETSAQRLCRPGRVVFDGGPSLLHQSLEAESVDLVRLDVEHIPFAMALDGTLKCFAQL
jgi:hypothetical protein